MHNPFHKVVLASSALLVAAVMTGCGSGDDAAADATPNQAITLKDGTGVSIELDGPVKRVACLTMICVDALTEVGITPVAYRDMLATDERYAGPDAEMREIRGGFGEENVEDIALATPDLVIGLAGAQDGLRPAVEAHAPLFLVDAKSWKDSVEFLRTVGKLTGKEDLADEKADAFTARVEAAAKDRSELTTLSMYGEPGSLGVDSVETPVGSLLAEVSDYPWPAAEDPFASVAVEQIAKVNPDLIFAQAFSASDDSASLSGRLATDPVWKTLAAARNDKVIEVEASVWATGRGTISLGLVLDEVAKHLG